MKSTFAIIAAFFFSVLIWISAAFALTLLTYTWPDSIFGESADKFIETAFVWLISPGIGTYYGLMVTKKYFPNVEVKTLFIAITSIVVTYAVIIEVVSIFLIINNNPYSPSVIEMLVLVAQSVSFIIGANLYKNKQIS